MPYIGEYASYGPLRRLVDSDRVRKLLGVWRVREAVAPPSEGLNSPDVYPSAWLPDWVLAVDGSHAEIPIQNGFPGAEASYITVASVMLDIARTRILDKTRPISPVDFRTLKRTESIDCALPGCNVVAHGETDARASLRRAIFDVFRSVQMASDAESLLDTYEALLALKPETERRPECPCLDCPAATSYRARPGIAPCSCSLAHPWFSTDALRIHEGMMPAGSNGALFAEVMQVWERVWIIHILRTLEQKGWLSSLRRVAIVLDGPLAVFGHPAWLSQSIRRELVRINSVSRQSTGQDLLLLGIEKTGFFVDHFNLLDSMPQGAGERLPNQTVLLPTDDYIRKNVIFSDSTKAYGLDTYFGRKFFYKTKSGARVVASVPLLNEDSRDGARAEVAQFTRLQDAMSLLDQLVSSRYPNALEPLVAAHAEAAIPLNLGKRILAELARELMG